MLMNQVWQKLIKVFKSFQNYNRLITLERLLEDRDKEIIRLSNIVEQMERDRDLCLKNWKNKCDQVDYLTKELVYTKKRINT